MGLSYPTVWKVTDAMRSEKTTVYVKMAQDSVN